MVNGLLQKEKIDGLKSFPLWRGDATGIVLTLETLKEWREMLSSWAKNGWFQVSNQSIISKSNHEYLVSKVEVPKVALVSFVSFYYGLGH